MDTLQVISQNIDTAFDSLKVLNDNLLVNIVKNPTVDSSLSPEIFETFKNILFIIVGALISTVFTGIRKHNRLFKLYEFINSSFISLVNRVKKYEKHNSELISKIEHPENSDFIPPEIPGVEIEVINEFNKEDLFEIFLIRLNTKHFENVRKDFLSLLNAIKYFETVFDKAKVESKTTVQSIAENVEKMKQLYLQLLTDLSLIEFESKGKDDFTNEIQVTWTNFKQKNKGEELKNYKIFEENLINPLYEVGIKYVNLDRDIRAFKLTMLLTSIIQEITNFKLNRTFMKEFLVSNQSNLKKARVDFIQKIDKFNQANFRKWFFIGLGKIKHDKNYFDEIQETNA